LFFQRAAGSVFDTVESSLNAPLQTSPHLFDDSDFAAPLPQEAKRKSNGQTDIDKCGPVIGDFGVDGGENRIHPNCQ